MQDWSLGPFIEPVEHYALLRHIAQITPGGVAVEFGVGTGESTRILAEHLPVIGFDSGEGLPEDWRPGFPKGSFAHGIPNIPNAPIVVGWFADTLPTFDFTNHHIGLVHIDCDLYSSTRTALNHIGPHLKPGVYIVFDEWHGYPEAEQSEQRAWREYATNTGVSWVTVAHSHEAIALRVTKRDSGS
jgi:predicted O-methyltransferase YrrM